MKHYEMNLRLFDGEGAAAGTAAAGTTTGGTTGTTTEGTTGTTTEGAGADRDFHAEFDTMVKGDYKEAFDARVQKIVQGRLKTASRQRRG